MDWKLSSKATILSAVGAWILAYCLQKADVITADVAIVIACASVLLFIPAVTELLGWNRKDKKGGKDLGIVQGDGKLYLQQNRSQIRHLGLFDIHGQLYTYRVGIANRSHSVLRDVEVRLTSLEPCPHDFNATGGHLHWKHDNDEPPRKTKQSIPPTKQEDFSDAIFIDVLRCFWPDKDQDRHLAQLYVCHIVLGVSHVVPYLPYKFVVSANNQEQEYVSCTLRLDVSGDGPPNLKPA